MRLADFIENNMESILAEWEAFAATRLPAAASMNALALRDHAQQILEAIAADLRTSQTREAQTAKSMGIAPASIGAPETAAQTHAVLRARSGFDIEQLAAEYRALRASVLRLWTDAAPPEAAHLEDVIRFNEAVDQALAESISFYSAQVEQARDLMLGMLGHDMRSPLQIVQLAARNLAALNAGAEASSYASLLIGSSARMQALLDELIDFNRIKLGTEFQIAPAGVDLATLFSEQMEQLRAAHPDRRLELDMTGDTRGLFDGRRLQRLLDNLVLNAIKYGAPGTAVHVVVTGEETEVRLEVRNTGRPIDPSILDQIFDPLQRGPEQHSRTAADGSLGLGLYISREIVKAHGGSIEVQSRDTETAFVVHLPRAAAS